MSTIKTIVCIVITIIALICIIPIAVPYFVLSLFCLKHLKSILPYRFAQLWARTIIAVSGCPMTVTGRETIPKKGSVCFVSNHVGIFDILLALAYTGRPFGFIAKKELLMLPGINLWILFLGGLFIDRKKPRKALKTITSGIQRIKSGGSMLIFPEGTRSRGGELGPFLPGSLKLATQSEALIVPMAISGSYEVFEKTHRVNAAPVGVHFLSPVNTAKMSPQDRKTFLAEKIRTGIAEALAQ